MDDNNENIYRVSISLDAEYQKRLEEYVRRNNRSAQWVFEQAVREFLAAALDCSFESWYAYFRDEGIDPERAEELAQFEQKAQNFLPSPSTPPATYPLDIPW